MKFTLIVTLLLFMIVGCSEEPSTISPEKAYKPFASTMVLSKTMVQEVLLAAYNNPDLNGFTEITADNRNDCPNQDDLNPDLFPKSLIYNYGDECISDAGSAMRGEIEILVTDKLGVEGMEIHFKPKGNFHIDGSKMTLLNSTSQFKAIYSKNEDGHDSYDLEIENLIIENEDGEVYKLMSMESGKITFEDVDENNDDQGAGPIVYLDDLAVIDFESMTFRNQDNDLMSVEVNQAIKFDLFCNCPLAGKVEITDASEKTQIVDYTSNTDCRGELVVDATVVECE